MGYFRPDQLPRDPAAQERLRDARLLVMVAQAQLRDPATRGLIDVAALMKVVQELGIPLRTRRGAAATLARLAGIPVRLRQRRAESRKADRSAEGGRGDAVGDAIQAPRLRLPPVGEP